jgi:hypothetical protein
VPDRASQFGQLAVDRFRHAKKPHLLGGVSHNEISQSPFEVGNIAPRAVEWCEIARVAREEIAALAVSASWTALKSLA